MTPKPPREWCEICACHHSDESSEIIHGKHSALTDALAEVERLRESMTNRTAERIIIEKQSAEIERLKQWCTDVDTQAGHDIGKLMVEISQQSAIISVLAEALKSIAEIHPAFKEEIKSLIAKDALEKLKQFKGEK